MNCLSDRVSNRTVAPADGGLSEQYKARWPSGGDGSWNVRLENWWSWRSADGLVMAEFNIDIGKLPEDVREKLAELDLELSEGRRITWVSVIQSTTPR
ncbi:unnamed protein product [Xylocopa violacea]|uniref:Uncharacterized protein n=1 Tax=Xylocopa violacea TaxID=135666 RepID=A0ABP1MXV9_XYLVO